MALTPQDFDFISRLVRAKSGIVLETGKEYLVDARLSAVAKEHKLASIAALVDRLKASNFDPLHQRVIEAMTTNETSFFRDIYPFEAFRNTILPAVMAARSATRTLSFWCGAASTGQEPYTIAMILHEAIPMISNWRIEFLCTDISTEMIARSKAGKYSQLEIGRGMPPAMLAKYFDKIGPAEWQVKKQLRDMIQFRELNLTQAWGMMPTIDICFLRNVLIYFDTATKKEILGRIRKLLRPDGYLFLGSAESTVNLDDEYERMAIDRSGCYRRRAITASKAA